MIHKKTTEFFPASWDEMHALGWSRVDMVLISEGVMWITRLSEWRSLVDGFRRMALNSPYLHSRVNFFLKISDNSGSPPVFLAFSQAIWISLSLTIREMDAFGLTLLCAYRAAAAGEVKRTYSILLEKLRQAGANSGQGRLQCLDLQSAFCLRQGFSKYPCRMKSSCFS